MPPGVGYPLQGSTNMGLFGGMLGAAGIGGAFDILGGQLSSAQNRQSQRASADLQREFAKHGIQWRVEDAKAAGLHPLAALGMLPASASPFAIGDTTADSFHAAGQNISNAVARTQSAEDKETQRLNNALISASTRNQDAQAQKHLSDMALNQASNNPPMGVMKQFDAVGLPGQTPNVPEQDLSGWINFQAPPQLSSQPGDPSTMAGINAGAELMEMPFGKMYLPSGKGQESPLELWADMPVYDRWGWIMYNANKLGRSWLNDFTMFSIAGKTHFTKEMDKSTPFPMDDTERAIQRAIQKGKAFGRRWGNKTWKDIMGGR